MPGLRFALIPAALALAVVAEWSAYQPGDERGLVVADGAVGFVVLCCAIVASDRHPESRIGPLMGLAGLTWFAGNFWPGLLFLHRGPLVHLHLSYPTGRLRWWPAVATVAVSYVTATIAPLARNDALTVALAVLVAGVAVGGFFRASGTARRAAVPALIAALAFAGVLALGALNQLAGWDAARQVLWAYDIVVAGAVIFLLVDLLRGRWAEAVVTDLVVDLGTRADTGTLRDALGRALGDRSLVLGYWLSDESRYVDDAGNPVEIAKPGADRVATRIERDGQRIAVLVHDAAVLEDPGLVDAVAAAAGFAVANARLHAETRERVTELAASRRRIVEAAGAQRQNLERDLRDGVQQRMSKVAALLAKIRDDVDEPPASLLARLDDELAQTRAELNELARGIHPRVLIEDGLAVALSELAARVGQAVALTVRTPPLPPPIEAAIYFLCAEGLANVAKHASASSVTIDITQMDGRVIVTIDDDGIGGADPHRGAGLRGLADRIETVRGQLVVTDRTGGGTRLEANIPVS